MYTDKMPSLAFVSDRNYLWVYDRVMLLLVCTLVFFSQLRWSSSVLMTDFLLWYRDSVVEGLVSRLLIS